MSPLCSKKVKGWYVHHPGQVLDAQRICEIMGDGVLIYEVYATAGGQASVSSEDLVALT
ncbi:hypothetical protein IscW_ISCW017736 [Ixodes scapularis]|uniref:Uncharacterized protein n=1 Tax=Ixodes scapularis TaxID=6945 RepID=B7PEZ8_IXOSC|nr:hypothetical protein IscW_ISCW017736 [Ixodes scapularis]|eukprot:XP_002433770.1 hypothetical protein IscW_ISCW017736 [Ixodes scapularis]